MKHRIVKAGLTALCVAATQGALCAHKKPAEETEKPVLEIRLGALSESAPKNKKSHCIVKRSHAQLQDKLKDVDTWISQAAKQPLNTAYHMVAQVPSVEIFAYPAGGSEKLLLLEDHSVMKIRQGEES